MTYELTELKKIRKKLGLTQKDLAEKSGVSQSMIAKIESGRLDPGYTKAKQIFDAVDELAQHDGLQAKDLMNKKVIAIDAQKPVTDIIPLMRKHGISQLPVLKSGHVIGRVSERLLLEKLGGVHGKKVRDIMEDAPPIVSGSSRGQAIVALLKHFSMVVVAEKGELKGVITKADVLEKMYG